MARRDNHCEQEDSAWEIALADLMTVLMVFFLVMWLTSIIDPEKRKAFVENLVGESGGGDKVLEQNSPSLIKPPIEQPKTPVTSEDIQAAVSKVNPKDIDIQKTPEGIKITLRSDSFFESGRATITDKTREQLEKLGETLAGHKQDMTITGYTDNVPISNFQFPSNWELSAARAATVARTFIYMGVEQKYITIEGKADNSPVAPNNSSYGRSLNRRVIIMIKNKSAKTASKVAPAATKYIQPPVQR
ncbi:OmpA/MotB family protein [Hydrogenovibrio kuenenii]|uniref:OmpA/MotB family protein n=1 Tax=Hydrogenovibrio kuenenii TaxID=63658 RepID=UPI000466D74E|nr:flagellar motor protein MotB [Hydrogenovibrio kuenenii]